VCSTPFGITEVGMGGLAEVPDRQVVCSTPFGITEVGIQSMFDLAATYGVTCSTPFGITEVGIDDETTPQLAMQQCSTPFGITEVGMPPLQTVAWPDRFGAQRLSASQRWA